MRHACLIAMLLAGCGARSHIVGSDGDSGDDDSNDGDDPDGGTSGLPDASGATPDPARPNCLLLESDNYRNLEGPASMCLSEDAFIIRYEHGIGTHGCAFAVESPWDIVRANVGEPLYNVFPRTILSYCPHLCCTDCGEDIFVTPVLIPARFGAGFYVVTAGDETITVEVQDC